jgi:outer membrane protein OmpA-like peptidoglycan-associated protein
MNALTVGKASVALGTVLLLGFGTTGCATKKYTRGVVAPVEARVSTNEKKTADQASAIGELENGLSRTDEKATDAERKAMDADRKAVAAGQDAAKANEAASAAAQSAGEARKVADNGMTRIGEVVENFDNYKLVTTEKVLFPFGKSNLTKDAKAQLDAAVSSITSAKNYVLEVQGFTDKTGSANGNIVLSQKRADEVVRYLTTQHQVPLRKIHVLGLGADEPTADNKTRDGRKQNRRVEMKVFALDLGASPAKSGTQASNTQ